MKIGIYPAAFDPIHSGHLTFARAAVEMYGLDKVYFLPEPQPRHKQGVKALEHRTNMVHLAVANIHDFGVVSLHAQEFDVRYIWPAITSRFLGQELFMLLGNNSIKRLAAWPHTTEFGRQAPTFVIAQRAGKPTKSSIEDLIRTKKLDLPYAVLPPDYETHSNSYIRSQLKIGKQPKAISHAIFEYIQANKLYHS